MGKERRNWDPVPAFDLVGKVMQEFGLSRGRESRAVFRAWGAIVPEPLVQHVHASAFRGGKLTIQVTSASLLEELRCFRGPELLRLLNAELGSKAEGGVAFVRRIDFRSK